MFPHNTGDSTLAESSTGNTRLADKLLYGRMSVFYWLFSNESFGVCGISCVGIPVKLYIQNDAIERRMRYTVINEI